MKTVSPQSRGLSDVTENCDPRAECRVFRLRSSPRELTPLNGTNGNFRSSITQGRPAPPSNSLWTDRVSHSPQMPISSIKQIMVRREDALRTRGEQSLLYHDPGLHNHMVTGGNSRNGSMEFRVKGLNSIAPKFEKKMELNGSNYNELFDTASQSLTNPLHAMKSIRGLEVQYDPATKESHIVACPPFILRSIARRERRRREKQLTSTNISSCSSSDIDDENYVNYRQSREKSNLKSWSTCFPHCPLAEIPHLCDELEAELTRRGHWSAIHQPCNSLEVSHTHSLLKDAELLIPKGANHIQEKDEVSIGIERNKGTVKNFNYLSEALEASPTAFKGNLLAKNAETDLKERRVTGEYEKGKVSFERQRQEEALQTDKKIRILWDTLMKRKELLRLDALL